MGFPLRNIAEVNLALTEFLTPTLNLTIVREKSKEASELLRNKINKGLIITVSRQFEKSTIKIDVKDVILLAFSF